MDAMRNFNFISLFSGAGGLDLGLEQSGWHCRYASDIDSVSVNTLTTNQKQQSYFTNTYIEQADVTETTGRDILTKAGARKGDITLLAGGPPCQSWSSAGNQRGFDDPRGRLWADFARIAEQLDVRWLAFENVRGMLTARGPDGVPGSALALIRTKLLEYGFQTTVSLLNAADFGVPQRRVRLFVLGFREGDPPPFPEVSHAKKIYRIGSSQTKLWVPLKSVLLNAGELHPEEIIRPTGKMAFELEGIKPGSGVKSMGKRERTRPGGHWGYKQGAFVADPELPSRTITASGQQDWILDNELGLRRLSPRECAAIQTFPDNYKIQGTRSQQYRQIGNAVPPKLGQALGQSLKTHIERFKPGSSEFTHTLIPLPKDLQAAINYTKREEASNGQSRRAAPIRKKGKSEFARFG